MNVQAIAARAAARKAAAVANLRDDRKEAGARADELWQEMQGNKAAARDRAEERELVEGHALDLFPTPEDLAARMVSLCNDPFHHGGLWVEPSAGTGRIAREIRKIGIEPYCIELSYNCCEHLKKQGFNVLHWDFLEVPPADSEPVTREGRVFLPLQANVIIMNPPFSNGQDIKHIKHAYNCLAPGGRIVALMAAGPRQKAFCDDLGVFPETLPAGTFKASGTMVHAMLVVIDK